ncbi:hypothetical protein C2869_10865 [Saccharobesus litoralis]|uniref:ANTAR domain-containing protein n=1 Tax=Saccharobesus litoralis TaxID=2172099 RepID=A0A2S0VRS1_9ALTE|nr:ANTAR domain-containing protein [Saccharobesus litoralis]AWB66904.1 hypothetical protein C2869_10865 [Saccharobesus litoralis]
MENIYHPQVQSDKTALLFVESEEFERSIKDALLTASYSVLPMVVDNFVLQKLESFDPDVIILDVDRIKPSHIATLNIIQQITPKPIVFYVEYPTHDMIKAVIDSKINAYIASDRLPYHVEATLQIAFARFNEVQALRSELSEVKDKLENRKWLDRAKGLIMQQKGISENDAHKMLRKMAMDKGKKMDVVARDLVSYMEAFS